MVMPDGTVIDWKDGRGGESLEVVPEILRELWRKRPSSGEPDAKDPNSFTEHYINLAPLPQFRRFDTATYLLSKDHHNDKNAACTVHSRPKPR
jgi:hypothetical protein